MILSTHIDIKISSPTVKYYKKHGFDVIVGQIITIPINILQKSSNIKIKSQCDICLSEKEIIYNAYNKYVNRSPDSKYRCNKCNIELKRITNKEKYGIENYTNREKYIKTNLEKYGGHFNKLTEFKDKIKKTNLEKYGVEYPMQSKEIFDKHIDSMIKNHGVMFSMQSNNIKDKILLSSNITKVNRILSINKDILSINYDNNLYNVKCDICGNTYDISPHMYSMRKKYNSILCVLCNKIDDHKSGVENSLSKLIVENYNGEIILNDRSICNPYEIDIYLPDLKLAFEFNGVYWHSEKFKDKNYHLEKTNKCLENGIQLIHIWEDDWMFKYNIIKSIILNKLNKSNRIFARKCEIKVIEDNQLVRSFLESNHIQGFVGSKIKIGLYYNNELISLMNFGELRKSLGQRSQQGSYELLRFCNKLNTTVIGGASKLFRYFINNYNPKEIISYADRSISNGSMYLKLGFNLSHISDPNYYYVINKIRYHRFNFRKDKLVKDGYESTLSESDIMAKLNIYKIYNSGNLKFVFSS